MSFKKVIINYFCITTLIVFSSSVHCQDKVIDDVSKWNHPVREVLEKNHVTLYKVSFVKKGVYPIFWVDFPYDPLTSPNNSLFNHLSFDVLKANGYWNYSFADKTDNIIISVKWNKKSKEMELFYEKISD